LLPALEDCCETDPPAVGRVGTTAEVEPPVVGVTGVVGVAGTTDRCGACLLGAGADTTTF
jgi:hypothetical protein